MGKYERRNLPESTMNRICSQPAL